MGTIEIVGYVGDGFIRCLHCICKEYDKDRAEPFNFQGTFKDWLKSKGLKAVTDQKDFGAEGCYCDCGNAIQESYCPKCGNATGRFGGLCSNCEVKIRRRGPGRNAFGRRDRACQPFVSSCFVLIKRLLTRYWAFGKL